MRHGDIQGKGKIYSTTGEVILSRGEKVLNKVMGMLHRGWVRYKLGWRTIMFKGYGCFNFTNKRVVYIEMPEYIEQIHTFNIDHELGDFGGWDYHAHSMRRAATLGAFMFFELPYSEITEIKPKKEQARIFAKDNSHSYKIVVALEIGKDFEELWNKFKDLK